MAAILSRPQCVNETYDHHTMLTYVRMYIVYDIEVLHW